LSPNFNEDILFVAVGQMIKPTGIALFTFGVASHLVTFMNNCEKQMTRDKMNISWSTLFQSHLQQGIKDNLQQ